MGDDIMSYNGGVALAMKGKECVAIACDKRYGVQNRTIATNFTKIFQYGDHCFVSFCGLATDVSVFNADFSFFLLANFRYKQYLNV
jgi:20S proteasome subunit beta 3